MSRFRGIREQPWRMTIAAVGGLLVAIIIAGLVGFLLTQNIKRAADEALRYDVEIEDDGDDLRVAVLDVRHYHRNLYFQVQSGTGVTRSGIEDFERAYQRLLHEIGEFEDPGVRGLDVTQPQEFREMAEEYYEDFQPAVATAEENPRGFERVAISSLQDIAEMEEAAAEIDQLGEELSEDSLKEVDRAAATATLLLLAAIGGLLLTGVALAYAAVRVVNELRKLYAEQQAATEKLEAASRAKTEFIADVSHELKTPLTVLRGNAQVGLALDGDCDHAEILEEIVEESKRMARMVEDLLFLARSDSASLPLDLATVAIEPFLAELAGRAEVLSREHSAELEAKLEGGGFVEIDRQRIEQAVLILVDNAAKYGPAGGPITLASSVHSGELRISVEDRGPGIPKEELPRIFERFYRLDKARSRKLGGTGLGLPIAKMTAEAHGGRIEAVSCPGKGTRMQLCLPLLAESHPTSEEVGRARTPESQ
jgi:two-component system sensor histidine kinase VicK